jgi:hypothetical protein
MPSDVMLGVFLLNVVAPFWASLIFASRAKVCQNKALGLALKFNTSLKKLAREKRTSLFCPTVGNEERKVYKIGTRKLKIVPKIIFK